MNSSERSALMRLQFQARGMVTRGRVALVHGGGVAQALQLAMPGDEARPQTVSRVEQAQPYGLSARPLPGAEAIVVTLGGSPEAMVTVQVADRRFRRTGLQPGEVYLHDHEGNRVGIRAGGLIHIVAAAEIRLVAPLIRIEGNVSVEGDLTVSGHVSDSSGVAQTMAEMRTVYNSHVHGGSGPPSGPM
jgi:phage gp45-like